MVRNKMGLLLAAAAAFGYYKYSKMTPEQKNSLKTRGKDFLDNQLGGLKNMFGKKTATVRANNGSY
jgi:hypothetical protein